MKIRLYGQKLKGKFALIHTKDQGENALLMIKHRDEFASEENVTLQDQSALSGHTIEEVAIDSKNIYGSQAEQQLKKAKN